MAPLPRRTALIALTALLALPLAACSGPSAGEKAAYCAKFAANSDVWNSLAEDPDGQDPATIATLREIEKAAPASVKGDWATFIAYLQALADRDEKAINDDVNKAASAAAGIQRSITQYCPPSASPSAS